MSQMVSRFLPHNQLSVSNLSKVVTQWLEVDSNIQLLGYKAQNISLHHCVLYTEAAETYLIKIIITGSCKVSLSEACLVIMDESDHYTGLRHFVYRHFVYRHFVYYCIPAYRTVIHPTSVSANHCFHRFQLLLTL